MGLSLLSCVYPLLLARLSPSLKMSFSTDIIHLARWALIVEPIKSSEWNGSERETAGVWIWRGGRLPEPGRSEFIYGMIEPDETPTTFVSLHKLSQPGGRSISLL